MYFYPEDMTAEEILLFELDMARIDEDRSFDLDEVNGELQVIADEVREDEMSVMSDLHLEIQSTAHDMGDDFGLDAETVTTIARIYNLPAYVVQEVLAPSPAEAYADLSGLYKTVDI